MSIVTLTRILKLIMEMTTMKIVLYYRRDRREIVELYNVMGQQFLPHLVSLCTDSNDLLERSLVEFNAESFLQFPVESVEQRQKACPLKSALYPTGNDFTLYTIHPVQQGMTQAV